MAIKVLPLVCRKCGRDLDVFSQDVVFVCKKCLEAQEIIFNLEKQIPFRVFGENEEIFLPFHILRGTVHEENVELLNFDNIAAGMTIDAPLNQGSIDIMYKRGELTEEILTTAGQKLVEEKKLRQPYEIEVWIPSFPSKNLLQYGLSYGKLEENTKTEFIKDYRKLYLPVIINSEEAIFIGRNLIQSKRVKENNFVFYIEFQWNVKEKILVAVGFNKDKGFLKSNLLNISIPHSAYDFSISGG